MCVIFSRKLFFGRCVFFSVFVCMQESSRREFLLFFCVYTGGFKACGLFPGSQSLTKIFFDSLRFIERAWLFWIPCRGCVVQATKNKEKDCSFLDAIGCRSCGRWADCLKIDMWENPSINSSGLRQLVLALRCHVLYHITLDLLSTCTSTHVRV